MLFRSAVGRVRATLNLALLHSVSDLDVSSALVLDETLAVGSPVGLETSGTLDMSSPLLIAVNVLVFFVLVCPVAKPRRAKGRTCQWAASHHPG